MNKKTIVIKPGPTEPIGVEKAIQIFIYEMIETHRSHSLSNQFVSFIYTV